MNLLLIRHATNDWVGKRLPGWTPGIHLNEEGRAQATALAGRLVQVKLAALYASPLERALETAQPLAEAQSLVVRPREALRDLHPGEWTGRSIQELREDPLWPAFMVFPSGVRLPGGESFREAQSRMVAELDAIRDTHPGETVAVVSHADPIRLAVAHYSGLPLDLFQRLEVSPASVTALAFSPFSLRLVCLNHTESLPSFDIQPEGQKEQRTDALRGV